VSGVVARLAAGPAALATRLVSAGLLQAVLEQGLSEAPGRGARTEPQAWAFAADLTLLLDNALKLDNTLRRPQSARVRAALREGGAVLFCVRVVLSAALFDAGPHADAVVRALAVLRRLVTPYNNDGFDDAADDNGHTNNENVNAEADDCCAILHDEFVADFIQAHGKQAVALLRYADELPDPVALALGELESTLVAAGVAPVPILLSSTSTPAGSDAASASAAAAVAVSPEEAVAGVRTFAAAHGGDWLAAFEAHIAAVLQRGRYPAPGGAETVTTSALLESLAPSAVALALLQARARECVRLQTLATVGPSHMGAQVVLGARFALPRSQGSGTRYELVVALHDDAFPSHTAHFRAATCVSALGPYMHRCFAPAGVNVAALPYVSLSHPSAPCAAAPLALPAGDLIFGEATAPTLARAGAAGTADVVYPAGTLLMCARSVIPPHDDKFNILCFVTFKTCAARLLPAGAVPVGRIVECAPQNAHTPRRAATNATAPDAAAPPAEQLNPHHPFDQTVMALFDGTNTCGADTRIRHYTFTLRQ